MKKTLVNSSLVVALAALSGCAEPVTAPVGAESEEVAELRQQVSELSEQVERLRKRPVVDRTRSASSDPSAAQSVERIAELERQVAELKEQQDAAAAAAKEAEAQHESGALTLLGHLRSRRSKPLTAEDLAALKTRATDTTGDAETRLQALRRLRGVRGGRSREVVLSMIDLVRTSEDADVRADVFRQLHRVTTPELEQPLLDALRSDTSAKVREEAAETLDHYLDSPAVVQALREAAENDSDRGVRKQARESLDGR